MASETKRDDRAMRIAAIVLVVSCGAPQAQPTSAVVEERPADWWIAKPTAPQDAAVVAVEADAPIEAVSVAGPDPLQKSVRDVLNEEGAEIDGKPTAETEPEDPDVTFEDGIGVIRSGYRVWCAAGGKNKGFCDSTEAKCKSKWSTACRRHDAWACFDATRRTSGKNVLFCLDTYRLCKIGSEALGSDAEFADVRECVIFRYDPKAKRNK